MNDYNREYQIHEHDGLRAEINYKIDELNKAYRFTLTGISGAIAWLVTLDPEKLIDQPTRLLAYWAPFLLTCFLLEHSRRVRYTIVRIADYLKRVEQQLAMEGLGWENSEECKKLNKGAHIKFAHDMTGVALIFVTLVYALDMTAFVITHNDMFTTIVGAIRSTLARQNWI